MQDLIDQNDKLVRDNKQMADDLESEKDGRRRLQDRIREELEPLKVGNGHYVKRYKSLTDCGRIVGVSCLYSSMLMVMTTLQVASRLELSER